MELLFPSIADAGCVAGIFLESVRVVVLLALLSVLLFKTLRAFPSLSTSALLLTESIAQLRESIE